LSFFYIGEPQINYKHNIFSAKILIPLSVQNSLFASLVTSLGFLSTFLMRVFNIKPS
jgi:hypothetical protein